MTDKRLVIISDGYKHTKKFDCLDVRDYKYSSLIKAVGDYKTILACGDKAIKLIARDTYEILNGGHTEERMIHHIRGKMFFTSSGKCWMGTYNNKEKKALIDMDLSNILFKASDYGKIRKSVNGAGAVIHLGIGLFGIKVG